MRELGVIEQRIKDDSTAALRAGDKRLREALSSFVAALKKERIDSRKEPSEADELTVLKRERKRRAEAIELYEGRAVRTSPTRSATKRISSRDTCRGARRRGARGAGGRGHRRYRRGHAQGHG